MSQHINRRAALQTLGLGGATFLVGCNLNPTDTFDPNFAGLSTQDQATTCPGSITLIVKTKRIESSEDQQKYAIVKVEFYRGAVLLGTDTTAPYSLTIDITPQNLTQYEDDGDPEDEETHGYYAKIYYQNGKVQKTDRIRVIVDKTCTTDTTPPMVSLLASSSTVNAAGSITLTATASDEAGGSGLARVEFLEGATLLGSDTTAPYTLAVAYMAANNGTHNYIAKAYDKAGNFAQSSPSVSVVVNIPGTPTDTTAPVVTLSSSSLNVTAAGSIVLSATATDNAGGSGVASVELFDGTTSLGLKTAAPFSWSRAITAADNGTRVFTAKATDLAGNVGTSPTVSVIVNIAASDTTPPTVSLASSSANVTAAGSITLTATASDNVGVTKVEFYEGATLLGTDTTSPYTQSVAFTSTNNGTHSYTAKAYDAAGNMATSVAVSVVVNISAPTGTLIFTNAQLATNFPSVGSSAYFAHPSTNNGAMMYRSAALESGGISVLVGATTYFLIAYTRDCTHRGSQVDKPASTATSMAICTDHAANFDCAHNGANTVGPSGTAAGSTPALPSLTITNQGGDVYRP